MVRVTIILPTAMHNYDKCLEKAQSRFFSRAGGFTSYHATGGWMDSGCVIEEDVTVVECYVSFEESRAEQMVERLAIEVHERNEYREDAIAYTVNNEMHFLRA